MKASADTSKLLFTRLRVNDLVNFAIRKKDDFGGIVTDRMIFHLLHKVGKNPNGL